MRKFKRKKPGRLPNLIIIGAQKCGTTSLHYYLNLHPEISMSREKELNFFIGKKNSFNVNNNWHKGVEWYKSNFTGNARVYGESSTAYTFYPFIGRVPEKMYSIIPETKLIYILRDPIERIISHYIRRYVNVHENKKISDALADLSNDNHYICLSRYYMQLEQYLNYFSESNILIITLENLYRHRRQTLQSVFRFLSVNEDFYSSKFVSVKNQSSDKGRRTRVGSFLKWISEKNAAKIFSTEMRMRIGSVLYVPFSSEMEKPVLDKNKKKEIIDCLKDDINRLRKFTGYNFEDWCV